MILIVSMNKDAKIETKIVPSVMETVIRRLMEKYEQAHDMTFINRADTWAVWQVLKEMRGEV